MTTTNSHPDTVPSHEQVPGTIDYVPFTMETRLGIEVGEQIVTAYACDGDLRLNTVVKSTPREITLDTGERYSKTSGHSIAAGEFRYAQVRYLRGRPAVVELVLPVGAP